MRILITNLLAVAALLFGATGASAYSYTMTSNYDGVTPLATSDTVTVQVFLDAPETGAQLIGLAVLFQDDGTITYDQAASALAGAQPSYILYSPASGMVASMVPAAILYPQQTPAWLYWNGTNPPGQLQVNINFAEPGFNESQATGAGIFLATLVFHIEPGFEGGTIELCNTCGGNVLQSNGVVVDPNSIGLGGTPITLVGSVVPEPTTAMLIGLGVLGLAVAGIVAAGQPEARLVGAALGALNVSVAEEATSRPSQRQSAPAASAVGGLPSGSLHNSEFSSA